MLENWVDIAILLVVAWHIADGVRRGFIPALVDLVGFLVSLAIALTFYVRAAEWAAEQWQIPALLAQPLAFAGLWIAVSFIIGAVGHVVGGPFAALMRGSALDLLLSILPSSLKGLAVAAFALTVILAVPPLAEGAPGQRGFANLREVIQGSTLANELVQRAAIFDRLAREMVGQPINETLTLLTIRPESRERVALDFRIEAPAVDQAAETRMLDLLNQERASRGLKPLVRDATIDAVARSHAFDMLRRGYFAHETPEGTTPFDRMRDGNIRFNTAGENLALAPTVMLAHQGLMDSPGHRANILRPEFGRVGIGAALADGRGRMFTQNFAN